MLNRPERLNAISALMREELIDSLRNLDNDPAVKAIVLTGAGERAFSTTDLGKARTFSEEVIDTWIDEWTTLYRTVIDLATRTITDGRRVCSRCRLPAHSGLRHPRRVRDGAIRDA